MTWRVIYDGDGIGPEARDFWAEEPARVYAELCEAVGRTGVEVVEIGGDAGSEPSVAVSTALGAESDPQAGRGAERRTATKGSK